MNSTIEKNEFSKSAIFIKSKTCPPIFIYDSKFISNIGEKGVIFHKDCPSNQKKELSPPADFFNVIFENNNARDYGGVLYYDHLKPVDNFINCIFYNNSAPIGTYYLKYIFDCFDYILNLIF